MGTPSYLADVYATDATTTKAEYDISYHSFIAGFGAAQDHYHRMIQDLQETIVNLKADIKEMK